MNTTIFEFNTSKTIFLILHSAIRTNGHWSVKDQLYIHLQLFREEDSVLLQEILHKIFYQTIEEEGTI